MVDADDLKLSRFFGVGSSPTAGTEFLIYSKAITLSSSLKI